MDRRRGQFPRPDIAIDKGNTNPARQDSDRHQLMPDKNIELVLDDLNNPQHIGEMQDEYKAHLAASSRQ